MAASGTEFEMLSLNDTRRASGCMPGPLLGMVFCGWITIGRRRRSDDRTVLLGVLLLRQDISGREGILQLPEWLLSRRYSPNGAAPAHLHSSLAGYRRQRCNLAARTSSSDISPSSGVRRCFERAGLLMLRIVLRNHGINTSLLKTCIVIPTRKLTRCERQRSAYIAPDRQCMQQNYS